MNIVVIGLGSMGKRRIRLIKEVYPQYNIVGVDGRADRCQHAIDEYGIKCVTDLNEVKEHIDCAFVCTSPLSHSGIIKDCLKRGFHVFSEINLVDDGYSEIEALSKENGVKYFLSSTFLYREEIQYIMKSVESEKKYNYIYHIGQYLPDWHPWENYKDFFVGDKRTNGCREIMAIELPWIISCFGAVSRCSFSSGKITGLNIDYDDNFIISIEHENGNKGALIVDVVSPCAVRKLEIYTEGDYISWDGSPDTLRRYDKNTGIAEIVALSEEAVHREGYRAFIVENAYRNEIVSFFEMINEGKEPKHNLKKDKVVIDIIKSVGA